MELSKGQQLYINGKWYMDITNIDTDKNEVKVRVKYHEGNDKKLYTYKIITLPITLFTNIEQHNFILKAKIDPIELKKRIGSLINRLIKESDITQLLEDSSAGMGAVSSPGMSGTPGVPGSSGSGDVSGSILPASEFGMQIHPKVNSKIRKKLKTKPGKAIIKQPVILLTKENVDGVGNIETENDYKTTLYDFLDYPTDNDIDIQFISVINKLRPTFLEISSERIKAYFKKLFQTNKSLIKNKASEWFQNNLLILGEIQDTEEML